MWWHDHVWFYTVIVFKSLYNVRTMSSLFPNKHLNAFTKKRVWCFSAFAIYCCDFRSGYRNGEEVTLPAFTWSRDPSLITPYAGLHAFPHNRQAINNRHINLCCGPYDWHPSRLWQLACNCKSTCRWPVEAWEWLVCRCEGWEGSVWKRSFWRSFFENPTLSSCVKCAVLPTRNWIRIGDAIFKCTFTNFV